MIKTLYHPITSEDRVAAAKMRAASAGVTVEFVPASRGFFDQMMQATPAAPDISYEAGMVGGISGWWCRPKAALPNAVILYLHGGAYNLGSAEAFRNFIGQIATRAGVAAFAPDYRLAPEHPFPAAIEDAMSAYKGLVAQGFSTIALAGDSAGGGLALVTLAQLVEDSANNLQPVATVVMSPWTDLSLSGASITERAEADPFLKQAPLAAAAAKYLAGHDAGDPLASPLFGKLVNLPPLRIHVGEDEILLDDSRRYAERAQVIGEDSELHVWEGMAHVFPSNIGEFTASEKALNDLGSFLHTHLTEIKNK